MKVQIEINWYAKNYKFKYCIRVLLTVCRLFPSTFELQL